MWTAESAAEAELATRGEYFQTGAKLEGRQHPTPPGTRMSEGRRKGRDKEHFAIG
jgi:hypothetical protein